MIAGVIVSNGQVREGLVWKDGKVTSYRIASPTQCEVKVRVNDEVKTVAAEK